LPAPGDGPITAVGSLFGGEHSALGGKAAGTELYRKPAREIASGRKHFCGSEATRQLHDYILPDVIGSEQDMTRRVAFYLRVSTGERTTLNQRRELEAAARQRGWEIVAVYEDQGVSGAKGRDKRPHFDRMLRDAVRGKFDILAAWAVDRLGRSLQDLEQPSVNFGPPGSTSSSTSRPSTPQPRAVARCLGC
jgi:Resolvase, N terminal domain